MNEITKLCRELRANPTDAEKILWAEIRNKKTGVKFRRQHPLFFSINNQSHFFISDFACLSQKIIIELDGKIHDRQKECDAAREFIIHQLGFKIIRFNNSDIINNLTEVLHRIKEETG